MNLQGTNQEQDTRFSDKEKKLMKQMKFGDCLNRKVIIIFVWFATKQKLPIKMTAIINKEIVIN